MENKEIIELIERGFEPEVISSEFNIPLKQIKNAIKENENQLTSKETAMDQLRRKYFELYEPKAKVAKFKLPTAQELEKYMKANEIIDQIAERSEQADKQDRKARRKTLTEVIGNVKELVKYQLTLEQLERIIPIIEDKKWDNLSSSRQDRINLSLSQARTKISAKLNLATAEIIKTPQDLESLQELRTRLNKITKIASTTNYRITSVDSNISQQIQKINTQKATYNLRHNISPAVESIIKSIVEGTVDTEKVSQIIEQEAEKRVNEGNKTRFALNKEQQKRQVIIQTRTLLSEQGDAYPIQDPNQAMEQIKLVSTDIAQSQVFKIVAQNLLAQRKYDELSSFCDQFIRVRRFGEEEPEMSKVAREKKKDIIFKKIGDMVVDRINMPSDKKEDQIFMNLLTTKMKEENVSPSRIKLGRNKSGSKEITLSEIMPQTRNR